MLDQRTDGLLAYEVAKIVGVSTGTLDRYRRNLGFPRPWIKRSRERLWAREEVEAWLSRNPADYAGRRWRRS